MSINPSKLFSVESQESAVLTFEQWKNDSLRVILRVAAVLFLITISIAYITYPPTASILNFGLILVIAVISFVPLPYSIRAFIFVLICFLAGTNLVRIWGYQGESAVFFLATIALTALLYERGEEFIVLFLAAVTISVVAYLTLTGQHTLTGWIGYDDLFYSNAVGTWVNWLIYDMDLVALGLILIASIRLLKTRFNKILAEARISMEELDASRSQMETRVNERTAELNVANEQLSRRATQLKTITELSESIAQLKDLNEIFPTTTNLICERFGFYHVGIFLVDKDREFAVLQAANSEGGKRMLQRSHRLNLGTGVVGVCAQTGLPRIALDVGEDAVFFNNRDLPNTRSEAALPLKSRGETIGVLDVQSTEAGAFSAEDLEVLTALANQVSISLENARLLAEARAAYRQVQEVYNEFTRSEWSRSISQIEQSGFRYQTGRIEIVENTLQNPEILSAAKNGEVAASQIKGSEEKHAAVAVPVKLRGEVIGILHIESADPLKEWQDDEVSLVQAVAERAAFAMENARLFQDARRRAAKERLISEATARISSAFNVENILQTTAEELERVLGGSEISIQFQSKE